MMSQEMEKAWELKMLTLLKAGGFDKSVLLNEIESLNNSYPIVAFSVKTIDMELCFAIEYFVEDRPIARITISSPNRKGFFEKKATGRNTTPEKILDIVKDIWNGKFKN